MNHGRLSFNWIRPVPHQGKQEPALFLFLCWDSSSSKNKRNTPAYQGKKQEPESNGDTRLPDLNRFDTSVYCSSVCILVFFSTDSGIRFHARQCESAEARVAGRKPGSGG
jgi:hypothetical protein